MLLENAKVSAWKLVFLYSIYFYMKIALFGQCLESYMYNSSRGECESDISCCSQHYTKSRHSNMKGFLPDCDILSLKHPGATWVRVQMIISVRRWNYTKAWPSNLICTIPFQTSANTNTSEKQRWGSIRDFFDIFKAEITQGPDFQIWGILPLPRNLVKTSCSARGEG